MQPWWQGLWELLIISQWPWAQLLNLVTHCLATLLGHRQRCYQSVHHVTQMYPTLPLQ